VDQNRRLIEEGVQEELQHQPHLLMKLAENALTVAESLRDNYFKNTARFVAALRKAMYMANQGQRPDSPLVVHRVENADWSEFQNEVVTFVDGGIGRVQVSSQIPILLRVGSYCVRTGERRLAEREQFGYYPVILGDLEGGSKERKDFSDIVRITAELLGGLSALERTPNLRVLMFHGPLVYLMGGYAGHTPFTEKDIDLFLHQYATDPHIACRIKEEFLQEAYVDIYPKMTDRATPYMSDAEQLDCMRRTMAVNQAYQSDGYVPVIHISRHLDLYLSEFLSDEQLRNKPDIALGGIVPNLLRARRAMPYKDVLNSIRQVRVELADKELHVFGIGGTATLHLAALLDVDSADSSGWRNRAARGIVQLPGRGDRTVANLGNWRGRELAEDEWELLTSCLCPVCKQFGIKGLQARGLEGFCNRATHNLWTLLDEARQIGEHLAADTYEEWYQTHVDNSIYRPLIECALEQRKSLWASR